MARANKTESKRTSALGNLIETASTSLSVPMLCVILSTLALVAIGVVMVYSASSILFISQGADPYSGVVKQVLFAIAGLGLCVLAFIFGTESRWRGWFGAAFYVLCMGLVLVTAVMGTTALGAQRWLVVGGVSLQGSEFAKIAFAIMASNLIAYYKEGLFGMLGLCLGMGLLVLAPLVALLATQSDLGTTMICLVAVLAIIFLSDVVGPRTMMVIIAMVVVLGVIAIGSSEYRVTRVTGFIDPWADADKSGYQLIHSFKALGAGGLFGVGIGNSYQKMLYLPEAETDFIFAIIAEELGLVGALAVVALFVVFLRGGLRIAQEATSSFNVMLATGLTTMLVFQAMLNIFCVIGFAPVTGKPLPFISSGGSSMVSSLLLVGILLSCAKDSGGEDVHRQRRGDLHVVSATDRTHSRSQGLRPGGSFDAPLSGGGHFASTRGAGMRQSTRPGRMNDTRSRRRR